MQDDQLRVQRTNFTVKWTNLAMHSGAFRAAYSGYPDPGHVLLPDATVRLRGIVDTTVSGHSFAFVAQLPQEARPRWNQVLAATGSLNTNVMVVCRLDVNTSGQILVTYNAGGSLIWVSFDGVSFPVGS